MSLATLFKLLFASLIVGLVLTWLDIEPGTLLARARAAVIGGTEALQDLLGTLIDSGGDIVGYVLVGAVVVVPIWLLSVIWQALRRRRG